MKGLVTIFILLHSASSYTQSNSLESTLSGNTSSTNMKESFYGGQQWLSDQLVIFSNQVDSFFGEKSSLLEQNGTKVQIYNVWKNERGADATQEVFFKLDFKLPNLQRRLQFNLEKRGDSEEGDFLENEKRVSQNQALQNDKDVRAGISYLLEDFKKFNLKFSGGARLSKSVTPYTKFKINRDFGLLTGNLSFLALSYWDNNEGFTQNMRLNYSVKLVEDLHLHLINDAKWFDNTSETLASQGPTLHHRLSDRRDLFYHLRFNSSSKPQYELDSYNVSLSYRQRIMRSWFFYEVTPYINFPREKNFKKVEGLLFSMKATIGSL